MRSKLLITAICSFTLGLCPYAIAQSINGTAPVQAEAAADPVQILAGRLNLEKYKATVKGLTQFGDRRQGTDRNRAAIDWIEAQLRSYGCSDIQRIKYNYEPPPPRQAGAAGGTGRGATPATVAQGGGRPRGIHAHTGVNNDPRGAPAPKLRELDSQPSTPGEREEVYCTKIGTTHPGEMYIVGGHMDGIGYGEAANDDGSGSGLGSGGRGGVGKPE